MNWDEDLNPFDCPFHSTEAQGDGHWPKLEERSSYQTSTTPGVTYVWDPHAENKELAADRKLHLIKEHLAVTQASLDKAIASLEQLRASLCGKVGK